MTERESGQARMSWDTGGGRGERLDGWRRKGGCRGGEERRRGGGDGEVERGGEGRVRVVRFIVARRKESLKGEECMREGCENEIIGGGSSLGKL